MSAPVETLYRRPLPEGLVPFASPAGRALFAEALASGGLDGYFALAEQFHTQADPAFCGLGTLVVALNALAIDPGRMWKGPWRWYTEELLDCCVPLDTVRARGLTLDELGCLARCNGAVATVHRAVDADESALGSAIAAAAGGDGSVVVASYDRRALGQTGGGHFSPIGGWHAGRASALVLDVARFKYPPHWVAVSRLHEAMRSVDPETGRSRGWAVLRRGRSIAALWTLRRTGLDARELLARLEAAFAAPLPIVAISEVIVSTGMALEARDAATPEHAELATRLRAELRSTPAYAAFAAASSSDAELGALVLLVGASRLRESFTPDLRAITDPGGLPASLAAEVSHLAQQLDALAVLPGRACAACP